jgi:hypothetical protein
VRGGGGLRALLSLNRRSELLVASSDAAEIIIIITIALVAEGNVIVIK